MQQKGGLYFILFYFIFFRKKVKKLRLVLLRLHSLSQIKD